MSQPSKVVLVSGGFDPLHIGHVRLIRDAARYGAVYIALNSDAWLERKKGKAFMPWGERAEVLMAMHHVCIVLPVDDANDTVCEAIRRVKPRYFANGGDRTIGNVLESAVCKQYGVEELFGIGGEKIQSSSSLLKKARR